MISKKIVSNILFAAAGGCIAYALFGCAGMTPEQTAQVTESVTAAGETVGTTLKAVGAATGNPVFFGVGTILTAAAAFLRLKNSPPTTTPTVTP